MAFDRFSGAVVEVLVCSAHTGRRMEGHFCGFKVHLMLKIRCLEKDDYFFGGGCACVCNHYSKYECQL